jgi:hypothetical protein
MKKIKIIGLALTTLFILNICPASDGIVPKHNTQDGYNPEVKQIFTGKFIQNKKKPRRKMQTSSRQQQSRRARGRGSTRQPS